MGVDYHVVTVLNVKYSNGEEDWIEMSSEGRYFIYSPVDYDSDSEGDKERAFTEEKIMREEELNKHQSLKLLYETGKWHITSNDKIELYENLIMKRQIDNETWTDRFVGADVITISKSTYAR